jgi:hypothetical protein
MKEIYPEYADAVAFYAVGVDPTETIEELEAYRQKQGYPWPMATAGQRMLASLNVRVQSTKIAFGRDGVITYRDGYGKGSDETWRRVFEELRVR